MGKIEVRRIKKDDEWWNDIYEMSGMDDTRVYGFIEGATVDGVKSDIAVSVLADDYYPGLFDRLCARLGGTGAVAFDLPAQKE